jgi:fatty acid desaturase
MQADTKSQKVRFQSKTEWPTVFLAAIIYGGWAVLTYFYAVIPWPVLAACGGWVLAWQMSLQHEVLHGHPTISRRLNDALGFPPLTLWLPYQIYRRLHLRHHRDAYLTDPLEDPESYYMTPERFARLGPAARAGLRFRNTFFGRITYGAFRSIFLFLWAEAKRCLSDRAEGRIWLAHLAGVAMVLVWVCGVCRMSIVAYLLCFVLPSRSLASIRAFAEHRAGGAPEARTAIVENAPVLGLLFLYNNLHAVHHARPGLPWYKISGAYRANRSKIIAANGGLVYDGYWDVVRRYALSAHHVGPHPGHGRAWLSNGIEIGLDSEV